MNEEKKETELFQTQQKKLNQKYRITIGILCALLFITCLSTILVASNSVSTAPQQSVVPNFDTSMLPSEDIADLTKIVTEIQKGLSGINKNQSVDSVKLDIMSILNNLQGSGLDPSLLNGVTTIVLDVLGGVYDTGEEVVNAVVGAVIPLVADAGKLLDIMISYDEKVQITSTTAEQEFGSRYKEQLTAYIYYAKTNSNKWAVLVHPFMLSGEIYANAIAQTYLDQGYNVIAPDLRGFGASKGSVAMGYVESLDIWDWLTYINNSNNKAIGDKAANQVIIHGTSLGGATTLQTWTQVNFGRDLTKQDVIGLVDDCGYSSMTGIIEGMLTTTPGIDLINELIKLTGNGNLYQVVGNENVETILMTMLKIGLTEADFAIKQDVFHPSRKMSNVPLFIIHGTADTTVPYSMSTGTIYPKAKDAGLLYDFWQVSNQPHAFVVIGMEKTEYNKRVTNFIKYAEKRVSTPENNEKPTGNNQETNPQHNVEAPKEEKSLFDKIGEAITNFFKSIGDFFKNLFK